MTVFAAIMFRRRCVAFLPWRCAWSVNPSDSGDWPGWSSRNILAQTMSCRSSGTMYSGASHLVTVGVKL